MTFKTVIIYCFRLEHLYQHGLFCSKFLHILATSVKFTDQNRISKTLHYLNKTADGEFLDLYWKSVFKKYLLLKNIMFRKKSEKRNEIKLWTSVSACYTINAIWRIAIFFLIETNVTVCEFNNFKIGTYSKLKGNPAGNNMFKGKCHWRRSGVFIVNFEHVSHLVLVFLLLTLNM